MNLYDFRVGIFHVSILYIPIFKKEKNKTFENEEKISAKKNYFKFNHDRVSDISESYFTQ